MPRGYLDEDEIAVLGGFSLEAESFDPVQKSIEIINRAESIMGEITLLQSDLKDLWNEARDYGLEPNVLKDVIKRRKKTKHENEEHDIAVGNLELRMDGLNEDGEEYEAEEE